MKTQNPQPVKRTGRTPAKAASVAALSALLTFSALPAFSQGLPGFGADTSQAGAAKRESVNLNAPTFWGFGVGLVFSSIPISEAEFAAPFSQLYYSWYITDPNASLRTALSLGLYGFGMILPVPKVSAEMFLGKPTRDIQGKFGVGGFYDIAVGGHGGLSLETGIRIANRYDISFVTIPFGSDSKRDYAEFLGLRDKEEPPAKAPFVKLPYFGIFTSVAF
jgi:hypothetical protein